MNWLPGMRGMVEMDMPAGTGPVMVWALRAGEKVSVAISDAAEAYARELFIDAQFAFIGRIPAGGEEFAEIPTGPQGPALLRDGSVTLVQAKWVPRGFVAVARGGTQRIRKEYQSWSRVAAKEMEHE